MKERTLFSDYFEQWVEVYKDGDIDQVTLETYSSAINWVKKLAPNLYVETLTRMQYQSLIKKYGETHELATTRKFMHSCNAAIEDALYEGMIKKDPRYKVRAISTKKHKKTRNMWLETDEVDRLEKALKNDGTAFAYMADFVLRTGLRYGEVLGITPADIDLDKKTVDINKTYPYKSRGFQGWRKTKNRSSMRIITLDDAAISDVKRFMSIESNKSIFVTAITNEAPKNCEAPVVSSRANRWLTKMCKQANIPRITFHNLRHTHASLLILNNVSVQSVANRLGHASTKTTEDYYIHLLQQRKEKDNIEMLSALSKIGG